MTITAPRATVRPEQSRARYPDASGYAERDGVRVFWERYGDGGPTILLMPTWSIIHSRHWRGQIPYLARHFRVVTFDARGNGRSDRPPSASAYDDREFIADAVAVLDASGTESAVVAGLSMGGGYTLRFAAEHPDRVLGAVMIGAAVNVGGFTRDREWVSFEDELPDDVGWNRYNRNSWRRDWPGFVEFFFEQVHSEPHSTKQIEDALGWGLETDAETMILHDASSYLVPPPELAPLIAEGEPAALAFVRSVRCPCLVIHGDADRIIEFEAGRRLAEELGCRFVALRGSGHNPLGREPVKINLLIREFIESLGTARR